MVWLFTLAFVGICGWLALRWLANADPKLIKQGIAGFALLFLLLVTLFLLLSGRASAALPFLFGSFLAYQRLRTGLGLATFLKRLWDASRGQRPADGQSRIQTAYLDMALDKQSGALRGRVLRGLYEGQDLASLGQAQLVEKYQELQRLDFESARLLEAFLDRAFGADWRQNAGAGDNPDSQARAASRDMTREHAASILGVSANASRADVLTAHKRLMKIAHPDQGGSDYLATQINAARDVLLKSDA